MKSKSFNQQFKACRLIYHSVLIVLFLTCTWPVHANSPDPVASWGKYVIKNRTFVIAGLISRLTLAGLHSAVQNNEIDTVEINSNGGYIDASMAIEKIVSENNLTTFVAKGSACKSAAVAIFLAGKERIVHSESEFMVHPASAERVEAVSISAVIIDESVSNQSLNELERVATNSLKRHYLEKGVSTNLVDEIQHEGEDILFNGTEALVFNVADRIDNEKISEAKDLIFNWERPEVDINVVGQIAENIYGLEIIYGSPIADD